MASEVKRSHFRRQALAGHVRRAAVSRRPFGEEPAALTPNPGGRGFSEGLRLSFKRQSCATCFPSNPKLIDPPTDERGSQTTTVLGIPPFLFSMLIWEKGTASSERV